jgi:mannose-6-phosphate isomerase-like protein (cupin superfamily)
MQHIEYIKDKEQILAIVISHKFNEKGIHFFTPNEFSQQLAYMNHPKGKVIEPHYHNPVKRDVVYTQEVLIIKKGKLKVDFYDDDQIHLKSIVIESGDIILLAAGGHGFEVIEDVEMVEVKQGPYTGDADKTRFDANKN